MRIILILIFLFASGCESGFFGPGGSFGTQTEDGDKVSCIEDLEKCTRRCEVETKKGAKFFRDYKLTPEECKKPEPPAPENT